MERRVFLLGAAGTLVRAAADAIPVTLAGKPFTTYYFGSGVDKPYLWPLTTAGGRVVSRGWPLAPREGETTDHPWHRGVWFGHGIVNDTDFWREGRDNSGKMVVKGEPRKRGDRIEAVFTLTRKSSEPMGSMKQEFSFRESAPARFIDARIEIRADAGQDLTFGDTEDGGFAFRLSDAFREDRNGLVRNSEGLTGTKTIWGKPARWVDYQAAIDGQTCGVAILDHPSNLRHPSMWHARNYALNAANPFATKGFSRGAAPDGSYTVTRGRPLVLRYQVVLHDGPATPEALNAWFTTFAR